MQLQLSKLIHNALLRELNLEHKPGLVTPTSSGAHTDMDASTFIKSIDALNHEFDIFLSLGSAYPIEELLEKARPYAIKLEHKMFQATSGINTHKGAIYLFSITTLALGYALKHQLSFSTLPSLIQKITITEMEKLRSCEKAQSYGQRIYQQVQLGGIIEEVSLGIPHVFQSALPFYQTTALDKRDFATLLYLMAEVDDSTLLHHNPLSVLHQVHEEAKCLLTSYLQDEPCFEANLEQMKQQFIRQRISPGGCADLLALTFFLASLEPIWSSCSLSSLLKKAE